MEEDVEMTSASKVNTREIALDTLMEMESKSEFSHKVIYQVLTKYNYLEGQEKAFMKRLVEGTLERRIELDYVLNQFSSVPVSKMKPLIRSLLRMGTYQILYMDTVPDSAACNEAVKLATKRKFHNLKGFVNGVLRKVASSKENIPYPDEKKAPLAYLSIKYSMPEWLVKLWVEEYGMETTKELLEGLLQIRPLTIRVSTKLTENQKETLLENIKSQGVKVSQHPYLSYAYYLEGVEGVAELPGYDEGAFTVQDISSMLSTTAAGIKAGDFVLDVCAAPGGKTMLAAELATESGKVDARDVSEYKTGFIEENIQRMKLGNVRVKVWDARELDTEMIGKAEIVLADVPCSGLGVIGKKQDIKYNVSEESLKSIVALQKEILSTVVQYVKEDGILLYSTCTIHKKENQEIVKWLCQNYSFKLEGIDSYLPKELLGETTGEGYLQLLPGRHDSDGFFFARLRKTKD